MNKAGLRDIYGRLSRTAPCVGDLLFRAYQGGLIRTGRRRVRGSQNLISVHRSSVLENVRIDIAGQSNRIEIDRECILRNVLLYIRGNSNHIRLDKRVRFNRGGELWIEDDQSSIDIGAGSSFEDTHLAVTGGGRRIDVGTDCMFAYDIDVRTGDSHAIVDLTGLKINHERDVRIGDRVWVGAHCSILKGSVIQAHTIVATRSTVTRPIDRGHVIIGGTPAQVLKEGVSWDRRRSPAGSAS